jgi:hypothetical protein
MSVEVVSHDDAAVQPFWPSKERRLADIPGHVIDDHYSPLKGIP